MSDETRREREERWQAGYDAYVADCKARGEEYIEYINWSFGKKLKDGGPEYVASLMKHISDEREKEKRK